MSPEELECDLPSWSCQTSPQPDPRPSLTGEAAAHAWARGSGLGGASLCIGGVQAQPQMLLPEPKALVSACVKAAYAEELPAPAARWEGLTASQLANMSGADTWAEHTGTLTRAPETHRLDGSSCHGAFLLLGNHRTGVGQAGSGTLPMARSHTSNGSKCSQPQARVSLLGRLGERVQVGGQGGLG